MYDVCSRFYTCTDGFRDDWKGYINGMWVFFYKFLNCHQNEAESIYVDYIIIW